MTMFWPVKPSVQAQEIHVLQYPLHGIVEFVPLGATPGFSTIGVSIQRVGLLESTRATSGRAASASISGRSATQRSYWRPEGLKRDAL